MIVLDDGSSDGLKPVVASFGLPKLTYVWQGHHGAPVARNKGEGPAAIGRYLMFFDSDDTLEQEWTASSTGI